MKNNIIFDKDINIKINEIKNNNTTRNNNNNISIIKNISQYWNNINNLFYRNHTNNKYINKSILITNNILDNLYNYEISIYNNIFLHSSVDINNINSINNNHNNHNIYCISFNILKRSKLSTSITSNILLELLLLYLNNNIDFYLLCKCDIIDIKFNIIVDIKYIDNIIEILYNIYNELYNNQLLYYKYNNFDDIFINLFYYQCNNDF
jgi:hypothetical protein